jgi:hypothetical protein
MMKERLMKAFYHKGRKAFVPWTSEELARRCSASPNSIQAMLFTLGRSGLATALPTHAKGLYSWALTETGKLEARAILAAEDFAKGGAA